MQHRSSGVLGLLAVAGSWGLFWGGWAALIPEIKSDLQLSDQDLGLALFAIPVAAVPAMLLTGRLAQRLAQYTLPVVTMVFAVGAVMIGLAPDRWTFTAALLLVGGASGAIEVALNTTMAAREARDGERLFNKVHAVTPLAMVVAAPSVGLAREMGASAFSVLSVIALAVVASAVLAVDPVGWQEKSERPTASGGGRSGRLYGPLLLIGAIGATVLIMENAVEQWGALHLEEQLAAGPLLASTGPAAYMAGLSVGRILAQWRGERLPDRTLVMLGGVLGGAGLGVAATAAHPSVALVGFAISGIGLAPVVPTLLAATGRAVTADRRPAAISAVTTISYAGFLSSPPLVGVISGQLGLPAALGLVALCGVLVLVGAQVVRLLRSGAERVPEEVATVSEAAR